MISRLSDSASGYDLECSPNVNSSHNTSIFNLLLKWSFCHERKLFTKVGNTESVKTSDGIKEYRSNIFADDDQKLERLRQREENL